MNIIRLDETLAEQAAPMAAAFRVTLSAFRGVEAKPNVEDGKAELLDFLRSGYPVFAAEEGGSLAGYLVCRIDGGCLWVEQLYVREEYRRRGVGSLLFRKAEELAASMGEETVYNYVHPNNEAVIRFLRSMGYQVLNLIEIRKPYRGEAPVARIRVGNNEFDY
jgi:ribosomal protein S18 acetylase RimI-like enzyme